MCLFLVLSITLCGACVVAFWLLVLGIFFSLFAVVFVSAVFFAPVALLSSVPQYLMPPGSCSCSAASITPSLSELDGTPFSGKLKKGQRLMLLSSPEQYSTTRDMSIPDNQVVITDSTMRLWECFNEWFDNGKPSTDGSGSRVLCVDGPSGTGKSTSIRIVAAQCSRNVPGVTVFHCRQFSFKRNASELQKIRACSLRQMSVVLFADQILPEEARELNNEAGPFVWVVMVSSANIPFFQEPDSLSSQNDPKQNFRFAFSSAQEDVEAVCKLHRPKSTAPDYERVDYVDITVHAATLQRQPANMCPNDYGDVSDICNWANGHLHTLVLYLKRGHAGLSDWQKHVETAMTKKFGTDLHLYMRVMQMFGLDGRDLPDNAKLMLPGGETDHTDARFFHRTKRKVLSPMFVKALLLAMKNHPPPKDLFATKSRQFVNENMNPSERGFAVERHCLQDEHLAKVAEDAAKLLGKRISVESPVRVTFYDMEDLRRAIHRRLQQQDGKSWALHAIPLAWNYSHVDAIQLYYSHAEDQSQLLVLGNQVTISTAQKHHASVLWLGSEAQALVSAVEAAFHGKPSPGITVALVFCCRVNTPENRLYLGRSLWNSLPKNPNVIAFSVAALLDYATLDVLEWERSAEVLAAQKLQLIENRTCKCQKNRQGVFCSSKRCGCTTCSEKCNCGGGDNCVKSARTKQTAQ